jgi:hypothetical protein
MYRLFTLLVLMVVIGDVAGATTFIEPDGVWWSSLSSREQNDALTGAVNGYVTAQVQVRRSDEFLATNEALVEASTLSDAQRMAVSSKIEKALRDAHSYAFTAKPISAYVDAMTQFYSEHPEAQRMNFVYALECIEDKPDATCKAVADNWVQQEQVMQSH